jgi:hypothetical protein
MTDTLGDALPREMARVRDLLPLYDAIGRPGALAATMMRADLDRAAKAMAGATWSRCSGSINR